MVTSLLFLSEVVCIYKGSTSRQSSLLLVSPVEIWIVQQGGDQIMLPIAVVYHSTSQQRPKDSGEGVHPISSHWCQMMIRMDV